MVTQSLKQCAKDAPALSCCCSRLKQSFHTQVDKLITWQSSVLYYMQIMHINLTNDHHDTKISLFFFNLRLTQNSSRVILH